MVEFSGRLDYSHYLSANRNTRIRVCHRPIEDCVSNSSIRVIKIGKQLPIKAEVDVIYNLSLVRSKIISLPLLKLDL